MAKVYTKPLIANRGWAFRIRHYFGQSGRAKRFTAETASSIKQEKLVLNTLHF